MNIPERIRVDSGGLAIEYERRDDLLALRAIDPSTPPPDVIAVVGDVAIVRVSPGRTRETGGDPVYADARAGTLAVPTGRAFVRFRQGIDIYACEEALRGRGFRISTVPNFSPHAAWVEPLSGDVADGLAHYSSLASVDGVDHVEPEILRARGER